MRLKRVKSDGIECWHHYTDDGEKAGIYRRIIAGLGWPFGDKPGFITILAEDLNADYTIHGNPHHIHVLAEFESLDLGLLHRKATYYKSHLWWSYLVSDRDREYLWNHFNQTSGMIHIVGPPRMDSPIDIDFIGQLVGKRIKDEKTLHFGEDSKLPLYFQSLPPAGPVKERLEDHPAIASLGYALTWIEMRRMPEPFEVRERVAQRKTQPSRLL